MKKQILIIAFVLSFLLFNLTIIFAADVPSPPNPDGTNPPVQTTPPATNAPVATDPTTWTNEYLKGLGNDFDKTLFPDNADAKFTEAVNQKISDLWQNGLDKDVKLSFVSKKLGIPKEGLKDIENTKLTMKKEGDKWILSDGNRKLPLDNLYYIFHAGASDNPKTTLMKDLKGITYFEQYGFRYEFSGKGKDNHVYADKGYIDKDGLVQGLTGFENNPISIKFPDGENSGGKIVQFGLATEEKDNPQKWGEGIHVWGKDVIFEVKGTGDSKGYSFRVNPEDKNFEGQSYQGYGHLSLIDIKSEMFRARGDLIDSKTGVQSTIPINNGLVILSNNKVLPDAYKDYKQVNIFKNKDTAGKEFLDISGTMERGNFLIPKNSESSALIKFPVESGKELRFFRRGDDGKSENNPFYAIINGKESTPRTGSGVTTQTPDGKTVTQNTQVNPPEGLGSLAPPTQPPANTAPPTNPPETQTPNPPTETPVTPVTPPTPTTPPATTKPEPPKVSTTDFTGSDKIGKDAQALLGALSTIFLPPANTAPPATTGENVAPPAVTTPPVNPPQTPEKPANPPAVTNPPETSQTTKPPETTSKPPVVTQPPKQPPIRTNTDSSKPPVIAPPAAPPTNLDKSAQWQVNPTIENPYYIFYS